jgi:hemoglobin-like flavoprotein
MKNLGTDEFYEEFYKTFKKSQYQLLTLFNKKEKEGTQPSSFYDATITLISKVGNDTTKIKITY